MTWSGGVAELASALAFPLQTLSRDALDRVHNLIGAQSDYALMRVDADAPVQRRECPRGKKHPATRSRMLIDSYRDIRH